MFLLISSLKSSFSFVILHLQPDAVKWLLFEAFKMRSLALRCLPRYITSFLRIQWIFFYIFNFFLYLHYFSSFINNLHVFSNFISNSLQNIKFYNFKVNTYNMIKTILFVYKNINYPEKHKEKKININIKNNTHIKIWNKFLSP